MYKEILLESPSKYVFEGVIELDGVRLTTKDGRICCEVIVPEKAYEMAEKIALLLTLLFGESFTLEKIILIFYRYVEEKRFSKEELSKIESKLKELLNKLSKLKHGEDILRAIKWWRKGYLENDAVDRFLDYYIAFEILASVTGYKGKYRDWVEKFSEKYSITYKPDGRVSIKNIRNWLMHAPGPEKDKAEELVLLCVNRFGKELLEAIRKVIDEATPS